MFFPPVARVMDLELLQVSRASPKNQPCPLSQSRAPCSPWPVVLWHSRPPCQSRPIVARSSNLVLQPLLLLHSSAPPPPPLLHTTTSLAVLRSFRCWIIAAALGRCVPDLCACHSFFTIEFLEFVNKFYRTKLDWAACSGFAATEALNASHTPGNGWPISTENEMYWGEEIFSFDLRTLSSAIFLLQTVSFKSLLSYVCLLIAAKYARCLGKQTETCVYSCIGQGTEYTGQRSGGTDDEMCVIVRNPEIKVSDESARKYLQEVISYQVCVYSSRELASIQR